MIRRSVVIALLACGAVRALGRPTAVVERRVGGGRPYVELSVRTERGRNCA